ncbi:AAEL013761-PA [Aedes aegypti]|uniref:AAEL013761-PA n=1 Tax=Aedes aegypti TaxID=7159 RepID=Q16I85_AEDAE|nr:AAEL013761-PA [Aedes aegypti]
MGLLFAKIWSLFGNEEHKLVMVGLDNAGKTTILYQFLMNEVVHTSPTIGSNVEEIVWKNIHFLVWDLGGQQSLRAAWSTYYTNTETLPGPGVDSSEDQKEMTPAGVNVRVSRLSFPFHRYVAVCQTGSATIR